MSLQPGAAGFKVHVIIRTTQKERLLPIKLAISHHFVVS